jgi:hypothetical protein
MAGTEHVDWMHLGDASGAADCLDRVLNSASAKAEDADKRCDLESELYSFYITAPVGRSCVCPIVGASQAAETTCSHNAPGTMNVYRASRGQAFASRMDNDQGKWCTADCPAGYFCPWCNPKLQHLYRQESRTPPIPPRAGNFFWLAHIVGFQAPPQRSNSHEAGINLVTPTPRIARTSSHMVVCRIWKSPATCKKYY